MRQRRLGETLDLLGRREIARVIVADARQIEPGLGVGVLHRSIERDLAISETGGVPQQILHDDFAIGRNRRVGHAREFAVGTRDADLLALERRKEFRHRIGEFDLAVLDQHHGGDRDQRLGHRIDAKDGIQRHRLAFILVLEARGVGIDELALARDQHDRAGEFAIGNAFLERIVDAAELLFGHSDLLGRRLFQAEKVDLRPGRGRGNDESAEQRRQQASSVSFH